MHDHAFPVEAAFDALGLAEPETEDSAVGHVVAAMVSAVEAGLHEMDVDLGDGRALDAAGASRPGVVRRRARSTTGRLSVQRSARRRAAVYSLSRSSGA